MEKIGSVNYDKVHISHVGLAGRWPQEGTCEKAS